MDQDRPRSVGGRKLPYEVGTHRYEKDPFRGQRRRPWMCFRVGASTMAYSPENHIKFIGTLHTMLLEAGVLLDSEREVLCSSCVEEDYIFLVESLKSGLEKTKKLYENGPLSVPIVLFITDIIDSFVVDRIKNDFKEYVHFFTIEVSEVLEWIKDDEMDDLKKICDLFMDYLRDSEGVPESTAIPVPIEEKEDTFGKYAELRRMDAEREQEEQLMSPRENPPNWQNHQMSRNYGPPGLPPPGLNKFNPNQYMAPPGLQPSMRQQPQTSRDEYHNSAPPGIPLMRPPGIPLMKPPGIDVPSRPISQHSQERGSERSSDSRREQPSRQSRREESREEEFILSYDDVRAARRTFEDDRTEKGRPMAKHDSRLAEYINGSKLYERFNEPFIDLTQNLDLLYVVNYAVGTRNYETQEGASKIILRGAFQTGFPVKLKNRFLNPLFHNGRWFDDAVELFFEIVHLYFNTARFRKGFMLTLESFIDSWEELLESWRETSLRGFQAAGVTDREVENLKRLMEHVDKWIDKANGSMSIDFRSVSRGSQENRRDRYHEEEEHRRRKEEMRERQILEERRRQEEEEEDEWNRRNRRNDYDEPDFIDRRRDEQNYQQPRQEYREELGFREDCGPSSEQSQSNGGGSTSISLDISDDRTIVNTDQKPRQPYNYRDDYEPIWMSCERREPPEDFRLLSSVPVMADYVNPTQPYLRRIQDLGIYKSASHYLDVQFRLLREDLVSPMRDGIHIFRMNGTCRGKRMEGGLCSDISIYNIDRVEGKQVTEREGLEMRIAYPSRFDIPNMLDNDREMKELGLVMLSDDGFVNDFHLAHIQTSLLMNKDCLHLAILDENGPFKPNKKYQMAEATSYLPSYKHVLENLKRISPFKPIPFERYIVHGKKTIFRPAFHRHEKSEEQTQEEEKVTKHYNEMRSQAASKRFMKGKAIPRGLEEDDDEFEFSRTRDTDEKDIDDEYRQLQEPIFRPQVGPSNGGSDLILIGNKHYHISRLLDEFHPGNLDESQRQAFCSTFRHELSIIQGPPGTGKTHIGVEIVKTMLHNRTHWKMTEPILIVCFTNSGLDNFLERVLQMIESDEELSKDNGRPKMIRYGRKCESEYLKRKKVMRFDVHDEYKTLVSEQVQRDQSRAGAQKRRKAESLALSSFTLYCSKSELLSFEILSRVMTPNHQMEIHQFKCTHVDSKEQPLNADEALACWLLDRDFGKATKAQEKRSKKSRFEGAQDEMEEQETRFATVEDDDDDEEEMDDEKLLDKLFNKMNLACTGKDILSDVHNSAADEYYTTGCWEIVGDHRPQSAILMGHKQKDNKSAVDEQINNLAKEVKEMIISTAPLSPAELPDIKYIFSLTRPKRWALYKTWCEGVRNLIVENMPRQIEEFRRACKEFQKTLDACDAQVMKLPMVIGATTTGCSRLRPIIEKVQPRILICEEAAEVLEAHIMSAMISSVEHAVMIGDHKQLRPNPAVHELGVEYGLQISMFERLVERGLPYSQLRLQHRMNTTISDLIVKPSFYANVHDAENVFEYPDVEGMAAKLFLWAHTEREETPDGVSWMNRREVDMTATLVKHLLKQNYTFKDIVVLATYAAQRSLLNREHPSLFGMESDTLIPVHTVDSFQGRESKIVVVSLVRSHRGVQENTGIGFLAVANRICVALTRAQHGMYIIGNGAYLQNNSTLWDKIVRSLDQKKLVDYELPLKCTAHGNVTFVKHPQDFAEKSPRGGCLEVCNIPKECGHVCTSPCHPRIELEHLTPCEYPCSKTCSNPNYRHKCNKRCYEECGSCMTFVNVQLACGHTVTTPCSRISLTKCDQPCTKRISCNHKCSNPCGSECTDPSDCKETVKLELKCGHLKPVVCGEVTSGELDLRCVERCPNRMLSCEHFCAEKCGEPCSIECREMVRVTLGCSHEQLVECSTIGPDTSTGHIRCESFVPMTLSPCQHTEQVQCGEEATTDKCKQVCREMLPECNHMCGNECGKCYQTKEHVCQTRCQKPLDCGHSCGSKCGEECPPCKTFCSNSCEHQSCGAGERGFGRECHKTCSMCIANCSNKCIHRSCSLKCFEECDVKPCIEPCNNKLKCGHACLGMCGEICPKVCGTCERQKYLEIVSGSATQKVHRLIAIPRCNHVFPVETLDGHLKKQMEGNETLKCPKCQYNITGVLRYVKYTKKRYVELSLKKLRRDVKSIDLEIFHKNFQHKLNLLRTHLGLLSLNLTKAQSRTFTALHMKIEELDKCFQEHGSRVEQKWRVSYFMEVLTCYHIVIYLLSTASRLKMQRKDIPPGLDSMMQQFLGGSASSRLWTEVDELIRHIDRSFATHMIGAFLPKSRLHIAKIIVFCQLCVLCSTLIMLKKDLSDAELRDIRMNCLKVLNGREEQNLGANLSHFEGRLLQYVPEIQPKLVTWNALSVPDF